MKIAIACLAALFPVLASATPQELKDKYVTCNCHVTPGLPWQSHPAAVVHSAVHHRKAAGDHKAAEAKPASPQPASEKITHHKKHPATTTHTTALGDGYPGRDAIVPSNKLVLPAGKSIYAPGQLVYISGRVLDSRCVPVSDAIVEIWQTDADGHYVRSTLAERLSPAPVFAGSGRATTDNLGRFTFVTLFPGTLASRAPFIHVHVIHRDFPTLDTEMFFADDQRNNADPVFSSLSADERAMLTAKVWQRDVNDPNKGIAASWDISLNGRDPYRRF